MNTTLKTPIHLWIVGVIALLWNAMGAYDYLMTQTENAAYMGQFTPEQLDYFYGFPAWAVAIWAIAVWGAVAGSVLLLLRKKLATTVFAVAFVAMVVSTIRTGMTGGWSLMGTEGTIFSAVIFVVALLLLLYSRAMAMRGVLAVLALMLLALPAQAQKFEWPTEPENLQVLEGMQGEQLRGVMMGFAKSLGVRCTHCHVGEEGQPLTTFDFASDARPNKDVAREMMRMVGAIDGYLAKVQEPGEEKAQVGCVTCHRGEKEPPSPQELVEALKKG